MTWKFPELNELINCKIKNHTQGTPVDNALRNSNMLEFPTSGIPSLIGGAFAAATAYAVYALIVYPVYLHPLAVVPGPRPPYIPFTIFGNLFDPVRSEIINEQATAPQLRMALAYPGGVVRYYGLFNVPRVLVYSSAALRRIFGTHAHLYGKSQTDLKPLTSFLGEGLLTVEDQFHKRQRSIINPVFRVPHLNALIPVFITSANELRNDWIARGNAQPNAGVLRIEVDTEMSKPTLDIIGRAGFGYDFQSVANGESPLFESYKSVLSHFNVREVLVAKFLPFLNWIIPSRMERRDEYRKSVDAIRLQCREILAARKREIAENRESTVGTDLLSVILKANALEEDSIRLNDDEVMAQVMTFLAAGHETTSVALTWTLDFLANNPETQDLLRNELRQEMPLVDSDPPVGYITSTKTYLDAVCKESLRLVPPAPLTSRVTVEDDVLCGYFIPKGTPIVISPGVNHRLPEYWGPDCLEFKPSRWMSTDAESKENADAATADSKPFGAYMPFLLGPRNCIGQRFAMLEMKSVLAVLVRNFEFVKVEQGVVKKKLMLTWKPAAPLQMDVKRLVD
ncbi:hypothetical protein HDU82_006541 [Entophlyctis luteolus]|nr:hypothetical protein HDU82_006541 [Entophlyctis luteolus]